MSGGTIYAGGDFTVIGGRARSKIAALDPITGQATSSDPNANSMVRALAASGGTVYAGGDFTAVGGQFRNRIAALDAATGQSTDWDARVDGGVYALAVDAGTVFAGGDFGRVLERPHRRIVRLSGDVVGVPEIAAPGVPAGWRQPAPNPFQGAVLVRFSLPQAAAAGEIGVYDLAGRLVRRLHRGAIGAGERQVLWDGANELGQAAAAGVYFVRLRAGELGLGARVVRVP